MSSTMEYKGYVATIEYSEEDGEFFGYIPDLTRDEIVWGGKDVDELRRHMEEAVDAHIEGCLEMGITPESPPSGRITFRTRPAQHGQLLRAARLSGKKTLNAWMNDVLMRESRKVIEKHS